MHEVAEASSSALSAGTHKYCNQSQGSSLRTNKSCAMGQLKDSGFSKHQIEEGREVKMYLWECSISRAVQRPLEGQVLKI